MVLGAILGACLSGGCDVEGLLVALTKLIGFLVLGAFFLLRV